jgi:hypothetical protein
LDSISFNCPGALSASYAAINERIEKWRKDNNFYWLVESLPVKMTIYIRNKEMLGTKSSVQGVLRKSGNAVRHVRFVMVRANG